MTDSSVVADEQLTAEALAADLFHPVILRVDYDLNPRSRSDLPLVQCIWHGTNTGDDRQRLMVFRKTHQWNRHCTIDDNNIDFVAFSQRRKGAVEQLQALFKDWTNQYPDWLGTDSTIVTVDGRIPQSDYDRAFVDMALVRDLTRVYEGLRAEITLSRHATFDKYTSRRANHNRSDRRDWFREHEFEADHFITEALAKDMLGAIDDLRFVAMTRLGKLIDRSLNATY